MHESFKDAPLMNVAYLANVAYVKTWTCLLWQHDDNTRVQTGQTLGLSKTPEESNIVLPDGKVCLLVTEDPGLKRRRLKCTGLAVTQDTAQHRVPDRSRGLWKKVVSGPSEAAALSLTCIPQMCSLLLSWAGTRGLCEHLLSLWLMREEEEVMTTESATTVACVPRLTSFFIIFVVYTDTFINNFKLFTQHFWWAYMGLWLYIKVFYFKLDVPYFPDYKLQFFSFGLVCK